MLDAGCMAPLSPALLVLAPLVAPASVDSDTVAILVEMNAIVQPCVQPTFGKRVFTRCFDTHSSIHAHWAAYRLARAVPALQQTALDSEAALEYHKVRYEEANFIDYVYAKAWFLRLATEYEKWAQENARPDPLRLRPIADEVARDLVAYYQSFPIDPLKADYTSVSWALTQLHQYLRWTGDAAGVAQVDGWVAQHFLVDITGTSFGADLSSNRFFSTFGNWHHLVHATQDQARRDAFWQLQDKVPDHHLVVNDISAAHSYGLGWSRVWALRGMQRDAPTPKARERFRRAAEEHIAVGMDRHRLLKGDFIGYDHWVPQFVVHAVTQGLGF